MLFRSVLSVEQVSAILRGQFGILPKRKAIGYSKPYPSDYDLIPLPPKYRLPEFTKFNGSERSQLHRACEPILNAAWDDLSVGSVEGPVLQPISYRPGFWMVRVIGSGFD